jgi:hypothetical protein
MEINNADLTFSSNRRKPCGHMLELLGRMVGRKQKSKQGGRLFAAQPKARSLIHEPIARIEGRFAARASIGEAVQVRASPL